MAFNIREALNALLSVSAYSKPPIARIALDDEAVEKIRELRGGQLQPIPYTKTRWFLADLETAAHMADSGDLTLIGQIWRSMRRDGFISGLSETRTAGLVALPKQWRGDQELVDLLRSENAGTRPLYDEMFPPSEVALLAADGLGPGVGVAELIPVKGRDFPVMCRLDPEFLRYRWDDSRFYYQSVAGLLPITPGDGRWILHAPGGRIAPWQQGMWPALGNAFITKEHARLARGNYSGKLANPARIASAPSGASEEQRIGFLAKLMAWGINNVIELPQGWVASLLESNGRGWEVFGEEIATSNLEIMIALAGQVVTVTGGTGFANADIHQTIRADLIKRTGDALAHTINTQGIPPWAFARKGADVLANLPRFTWDTAPPADRKVEAETMSATAKGIADLRRALADAGIKLDVAEIVSRGGITVAKGAPDANAATPDPVQEAGEIAEAQAAAKPEPAPEPQAWGTDKPKPKMVRDDN